MRLDNKILYDFFKEKDVHFLYHANTVATSITYFEQNGLLSRGGVEHLGLYQSGQSSDELDKHFGIWDDIFIDTVDLHGYFLRQNLYGPILFESNSELLLNNDFEIWITKNNPVHWNKDIGDEEKYFLSIEELAEKWDTIQRQRKMVTLRNSKQPILFEYINKIIVDDPRVKIKEGGIHLLNVAKEAIKNAVADKSLIKNKFIMRDCDNCYCKSNYLNQVAVLDLKRLFLPKS